MGVIKDKNGQLIDWEEFAEWEREIPDDSPYKNLTPDEILELFDENGNLIDDKENDVEIDWDEYLDELLIEFGDLF